VKTKVELRAILKEYLEKNEYEGLVNVDLECGCSLEDLMPCDAPCVNCEAGHKERQEENAEFDWVIVPGKKDKRKKIPGRYYPDYFNGLVPWDSESGK